VGDRLVKVEEIEGEHVYMYLNLVEFCCFSGTSSQYLEGEKLFVGFVGGNNLAVYDEAG
jgi:hypothetical protein